MLSLFWTICKFEPVCKFQASAPGGTVSDHASVVCTSFTVLATEARAIYLLHFVAAGRRCCNACREYCAAPQAASMSRNSFLLILRNSYLPILFHFFTFRDDRKKNRIDSFSPFHFFAITEKKVAFSGVCHDVK